MISLIVAMAKNRVIGHKNQLPWHLPADLKHFKALTLKKPIIMGRKTFDSIGKPLPERLNIVITHNLDFHFPDIQIAHSLNEAIQQASNAEEIIIIGGAKIFSEALPKAQRIYLTLIKENFLGDTFFPEINPEEWLEISCENFTADKKNPYDYSFILLERKSSI